MVSPLGSALQTLVKWRDAFAAAAAALQPVFDAEAGSTPPPVTVAEIEPAPRQVKALPGKVQKRTDKPTADGRSRAGGTDPKVIARIQNLAGKGLSITAIAERTGVSAPTAKKYAEGYRPAQDEDETDDDADPEPTRQSAQRRSPRFQEIAPRRCGKCQQLSTSNPCAHCNAPL